MRRRGSFLPMAPLRLGISACLLGHEVRWDGGHKRDHFLAETLGRFVEWVPVCPEVELGLGVPREPIRLEGDPAAPRLVAANSRRDLTRAMTRLARARAAELARLDLVGYVFKKDSPSCGMERVRVHGEGGRPLRRGTDRKSTRLNSSHGYISYAVFCLKKKKHYCADSASHHSTKLHLLGHRLQCHRVKRRGCRYSHHQ